MMTTTTACLLAAGLAACTIDEPATSSVDQYGMNMQGMNMQGLNMQGMNKQGMNMQGMNMQGFSLDGATIDNHQLHDVRVEQGEVIGEHGSHVVRGTELVGAHFVATVTSNDTPPIVAELEYRITAVQSELSS